MIKIDFDTTGVGCRIYEDGKLYPSDKPIEGFAVTADAATGHAVVKVGGAERKFKELYLSAKEEIIDGPGTDHRKRAGKAKTVGKVRGG